LHSYKWEFDGDMYLGDGIKVGYLRQEPQLDDGETVMENVMAGVAAVQADLDEFGRISMEMADPE
jgi:ATPase subunit of ABC transporter with duplicated ATPase domains